MGPGSRVRRGRRSPWRTQSAPPPHGRVHRDRRGTGAAPGGRIPGRLAQPSRPTACRWISAVTRAAGIRFPSSDRVGTTRGSLRCRGKRGMAIEAGQSLGCFSRWWSSGSGSDRSLQAVENLGTVVVFAGHQVVRRTAGSGMASVRRVRSRFCWWAWDGP